MAGEDVALYVKKCLHRLVIGNTLRVVALHYASNLFWRHNGFLLYHLIVADDIENDIRSYN